MTRDLRLREAVATDAGIIVRWFPDRVQALLWGGPDVPQVLTAEWLVEQFADASRKTYVLVDDAECLRGTYALREIAEESRLHIGRFGVAPEMRGFGIGTRMLDMATALARRLGHRRLTLFVYDTNVDARRLYERYGFRDVEPGFALENEEGRMALMEHHVLQ
jgi:RimJ/RimL family protein N-acetyltransferase